MNAKIVSGPMEDAFGMVAGDAPAGIDFAGLDAMAPCVLPAEPRRVESGPLEDDFGKVAGYKQVEPAATIVREGGSTVQVWSGGPREGLWPGDSVTIHCHDGMILADTLTGERIFARQGETYICKGRDTTAGGSTWQDTACQIAGLLLIGVAFVVGAIWAVGGAA